MTVHLAPPSARRPPRRTVLVPPPPPDASPRRVDLPALVVGALVAVVVADHGGTASGLAAGAVLALATRLLGDRVVAPVRRRRSEQRRAADLAAVEDAVAEAKRSAQEALLATYPPTCVVADRVLRPGARAAAPPTGWLVLGTGRVGSGVEVVRQDAPGREPDRRGVADATTEAWGTDAAHVVDAGPLCVDPAGGVVVAGPRRPAEAVVAGYRLQIVEAGGDPGWARAEAADPSRRPDPDDGRGTATAACVVEVDVTGRAVVTRRDGRACRVPVTVTAASRFVAPDSP